MARLKTIHQANQNPPIRLKNIGGFFFIINIKTKFEESEGTALMRWFL